MARQPRGVCAFCEHETTKGAMARHLAGCSRRQERAAGADAAGRRPEPLLHLRLQDGFGGSYWLDVEVRERGTLKDLDSYLRLTWLECCGHLSEFSDGGWGGAKVPLGQKVGAAFRDGASLTHIYDFGTESVTVLKPLDRRNGPPLSNRPVTLLARNLAPDVPCASCDQPATHLCQECQIEWGTPGTLCAEHAKAHPHEEYGEPVAIVNSPRMGLCGYTGPADPPS